MSQKQLQSLLQELSNSIFSIKEKINDLEFKELNDLCKKIYEWQQQNTNKDEDEDEDNYINEHWSEESVNNSEHEQSSDTDHEEEDDDDRNYLNSWQQDSTDSIDNINSELSSISVSRSTVSGCLCKQDALYVEDCSCFNIETIRQCKHWSVIHKELWILDMFHDHSSSNKYCVRISPRNVYEIDENCDMVQFNTIELFIKGMLTKFDHTNVNTLLIIFAAQQFIFKYWPFTTRSLKQLIKVKTQERILNNGVNTLFRFFPHHNFYCLQQEDLKGIMLIQTSFLGFLSSIESDL